MANSGTFTGTGLSGASASDAELCRISGYLRDIHGNPLAGMSFVVRHKSNPIGVPSAVILRGRNAIRSNAEGYVVFDLYRQAEVDVELPGLLTEFVCHCTVPDAASIDLNDFLFPYLVSVDWVDDTPLVIEVGASALFELEGTLSNGVVIEIPASAATIISDDEDVATVSSYVLGIAPGSTSIEVTDVDTEALEIRMRPDGVFLEILGTASPTFPTALAVTVT